MRTGLLAGGLYAKERLRSALLAAGAVWTAHEAVARRLAAASDRAEAQRRIDAMSGEHTTFIVCGMALCKVGWRYGVVMEHGTAHPK